MKKFAFLLLSTLISTIAFAQTFQTDFYDTGKGKLVIHFIGHGTLMFQYNGMTVHVDPWTKLANYASLPKADLILITHAHGDHLDTAAIRQLSQKNTLLICNAETASKIGQGFVMRNGDSHTFLGLDIQAVPAYNTTPGKERFHPKGRDNGYVIQFGNKKVYVAGDTEDISEMAQLKDIDIAFLPVNQPYTMLPEQVVKAVTLFHPTVLYPYHFGDTDFSKVQALFTGDSKTKVIVRAMK